MARPEKTRTAPPRGVTPAQLREAERGLRLILAPTFSAAWIAQNLRDLLGEANAEYAEWLRDHRPAPNPPGWLIERARWRALDLVARENRRSGPPLESVIHSAEDPAPTPDETLLERDRHRRIADALSHIPEKDRRLLALVYYEGHSIRAAGRLLGWGKSNADSHHAEAMKRLRALVGPRDLLSPALVGLVAQATALRDRGRLLGGIASRISAAVQDLADLVARTVGSTTRRAGEAARSVAPFTDTGTAAVSGGAGRVIAQCGALATAAICSAILLSPIEHGVEAVLPHGHPGSSAGHERSRSSEPPSAAEPHPSSPPAIPAPQTEEPSRSSGPSRSELRRRRQRARRRSKIGRARRARKVRKTKAKAKASKAKRNSNIEAPEEVAPEVTEPAPEPEAVVPEAESSPPPPATGGQTRGEFGL